MKINKLNILDKDALFIIIVTTAILVFHLFATLFINQVNWDFFDFLVAGLLLLGIGSVYLLTTKLLGIKHRRITALVLITILTLIWAELAVGLFGTPFAGN